ncbi:TetR/AcrR family transcriptional regulator [Roseibium suaedae]|uniref:Transcriptional regulator, TetR family n=1 Tax=Roseibium suaedae TaxID=735517 RepID=A0A1M7F1I9_9HYPH|nr:TetR/AcrR family transcriptional regulator [Roseibium suaedae]SHL97539.1 transcriptional regulator, TetR family [Roseibium suaedae]
MIETDQVQEGWRERKRRETLDRIADTALTLFVKNGYDATTLDAIAEASGISRRTFFYYFKSKEEILATWQRELPETFRAAILAEPSGQHPFDVLQNAHLKLIANLDPQKSIAIYRIIRSSEYLLAMNQSKYLKLEQTAFEALRELWPDKSRMNAMRIVAMVSVGILRLSLENWAEGQEGKSLETYLKEEFEEMRKETLKL